MSLYYLQYYFVSLIYILFSYVLNYLLYLLFPEQYNTYSSSTAPTLSSAVFHLAHPSSARSAPLRAGLEENTQWRTISAPRMTSSLRLKSLFAAANHKNCYYVVFSSIIRGTFSSIPSPHDMFIFAVVQLLHLAFGLFLLPRASLYWCSPCLASSDVVYLSFCSFIFHFPTSILTSLSFPSPSLSFVFTSSAGWSTQGGVRVNMESRRTRHR